MTIQQDKTFIVTAIIMHASDDNNTSYILPEVPSDSNEDYSDDEMLESIARNTHGHKLIM